jgi:hypothetical protein
VVASRRQCSANDQISIRRVQSGQTVTQVYGNTLGDTGRDPQHAGLAGRTRQAPTGQGAHRRPPSDERHQIISGAGNHMDEPGNEVVAAQPPLMPDQQPNRCLQVVQPVGVRPQRSRQLIEARSVSGTPSTGSITSTSVSRWACSPPGDWCAGG